MQDDCAQFYELTYAHNIIDSTPNVASVDVTSRFGREYSLTVARETVPFLDERHAKNFVRLLYGDYGKCSSKSMIRNSQLEPDGVISSADCNTSSGYANLNATTLAVEENWRSLVHNTVYISPRSFETPDMSDDSLWEFFNSLCVSNSMNMSDYLLVVHRGNGSQTHVHVMHDSSRPKLSDLFTRN